MKTILTDFKFNSKLLAIILFVTLVVGFTGVASAEIISDEWQWIGSDDKTGIFFNTESFQKTGDTTYVVWIKLQFTEAYGKEMAKEFGYNQFFSHMLFKNEYDYYNKQERNMYIDIFDEFGEVFDSFEGSKTWEVIILDSDSEVIFNATYDYYKQHYQ